MFFSIFRFSDSRFSNSSISAKYCPIITNLTSMESLFIMLFIMLSNFNFVCQGSPVPGQDSVPFYLRVKWDWNCNLCCFLQVDHAKVLHYVGAGLAFPGSLLFVSVQTLLSYRGAETPRDFQTAHLRLTLTALAFTTLILNIHYIQCS